MEHNKYVYKEDKDMTPFEYFIGAFGVIVFVLLFVFVFSGV